MDLLSDLLEDWPGWILIFLLVVCVAAVPFAIYASVEDGRKWEEFRISHDCRVVAHIKGSVQTGTGVVGGKVGIVTTVEPDKTGWLCNDGVTYYR